MGISRFNSEGYYDPTAHEAVCNIEKKPVSGDLLFISVPLIPGMWMETQKRPEDTAVLRWIRVRYR